MGQLLDWTQHSPWSVVQFASKLKHSNAPATYRRGREKGGGGGIRFKAAYTFGATCRQQLSSPFRHKQFTIKSSRGNNAIARVETVTFWDRIGFCRGEKGREGRGEERGERREKREEGQGDKQLSFLYASESFIYELGQLTQGLATHTHKHSREGGTTQARKKVNVLLQLQRLSLFTPPPHLYNPLPLGMKLAIVFDFDFDMEMVADDGREAGGTICCGYVQSKCQECSLMLSLSLSVFPSPLSLSRCSSCVVPGAQGVCCPNRLAVFP